MIHYKNNIETVYYGNNKIEKAYKGNNLVYEAGGLDPIPSNVLILPGTNGLEGIIPGAGVNITLGANYYTIDDNNPNRQKKWNMFYWDNNIYNISKHSKIIIGIYRASASPPTFKLCAGDDLNINNLIEVMGEYTPGYVADSYINVPNYKLAKDKRYGVLLYKITDGFRIGYLSKIVLYN